MSREDKKIFTSLQHSRATILKLKDARDTKRKHWVDDFIEQVSKPPIETKQNIAPFEQAVARASDALSLGNNRKFTTAIDFLRNEIFAAGTELFNQRYYNKLLNVVLSIFQGTLASAFHTYERQQYLKDAIDTEYIAKSAKIIDEARMIEFMEDEYNE